MGNINFIQSTGNSVTSKQQPSRPIGNSAPKLILICLVLIGGLCTVKDWFPQYSRPEPGWSQQDSAMFQVLLEHSNDLRTVWMQYDTLGYFFTNFDVGRFLTNPVSITLFDLQEFAAWIKSLSPENPFRQTFVDFLCNETAYRGDLCAEHAKLAEIKRMDFRVFIDIYGTGNKVRTINAFYLAFYSENQHPMSPLTVEHMMEFLLSRPNLAKFRNIGLISKITLVDALKNAGLLEWAEEVNKKGIK